jgi:hypothetical protein
MFKVYLLPEFKKRAQKLLSKKELLELENIIIKELSKKGDKVGKPLSFPFIREKKLSGKRIYYLVYKDIAIILLIDVSDKKNQKKVIEEIKKRLDEYRDYIYSLIKKD